MNNNLAWYEQLLEDRKKKGLSIAEQAKRIGVEPGRYGGLLQMKNPNDKEKKLIENYLNNHNLFLDKILKNQVEPNVSQMK